MKVIGIDPSTYVGMAFTSDDPDEDRGKCIHFDGATGQKRLRMIENAVASTLHCWEPDRVMIEAYNYNNRFSLVDMVEIGTVIRQHLLRSGITWYEVPPTSLKKWTTGKGSAKKPVMAASVKERWGFISSSDDIVDAFALAKMGQLPLGDLLKIKGVKPGC